MRELWLVTKNEYRKIAGKKSFIIATLGMPLLIAVIMVIVIVVSLTSMDRRPLGYVDDAGVIRADALAALDDQTNSTRFIGYADEAAARSALERKEIQAYYVIPSAYLEGATLRRYYLEKDASDIAREAFSDFLRASLIVQQLPEEWHKRAYYGSLLTVTSLSGDREASLLNFLDLLLPVAGGMFFFFVVMTSGGYMLQAVSDEKENRTMEILATSLMPEQIIAGKALGLMGVALTQLGLWLLTLIVGALVALQFLPSPLIPQIPWDTLGLMALYFFPAFTLVSGIMTAISGVMGDYEQAQQVSGLLNLLFTFPMFFLGVIIANPNHPILIVLSLFPTTSFVTILFRWGFTIIPWWQLIASWVILVAAAGGSVWLAAQLFRLGMLHYGQRLAFKSILATLRQGGKTR